MLAHLQALHDPQSSGVPEAAKVAHALQLGVQLRALAHDLVALRRANAPYAQQQAVMRHMLRIVQIPYDALGTPMPDEES